MRATYSNLVKAHLMTNSLYFCGFLALILIQKTLTNYLDPCLVKTNVKFVFAPSDSIFRLYMQKKRWKFGILDLLIIIKDVSVLIRQLMDTIMKVDPLSFHCMYHSPCYIAYCKYASTYYFQNLS